MLTYVHRGRSVVAERASDGREVRTDNLIGIQDGSAFDREWRGNASATAINQTRTQQRAATQAAPTLHGPPSMMMGTLGMPSMYERPQITHEDRRAAREGAARHEADRQRIIEEARAMRGGGGGGGGSRSVVQHAASREHGSRRSGPRGGDADAALASRLAAHEAQRAGMY